ncbi:MAG: hypothetical protein HZB20_10510 [Chloroflexi bacterium]|nr:hypothetical protein [Chloroflexota bacterium]
MSVNIFLATTGNGLARASRSSNGHWAVEDVEMNPPPVCLAADPLDPALVYTGTQGGGALRSTDGGQTWQPAGLAGRVVKALAVSRAEPGAIYAGTKSAAQMFVSRDHGAHWDELESFRRIPSCRFWLSPAEPPFSGYVQSIALSPTDPRALIVGIEAGAVVQSSDGGLTWTDHRPGALRDCHSLTAHALQGEWVYEAGGTGAGVAFSRDGGRTWKQPAAGLDRHYGWACAADPLRPDVWYASRSPMWLLAKPGAPAAHIDGYTHAHIFRSMGGAPWEKLSGGLPQPLDYMAYALLTDLAAPGRLYAGLSNGDVWQTTDYGDSWHRLPFNLKGIHRSLAIL